MFYWIWNNVEFTDVGIDVEIVGCTKTEKHFEAIIALAQGEGPFIEIKDQLIVKLEDKPATIDIFV